MMSITSDNNQIEDEAEYMTKIRLECWYSDPQGGCCLVSDYKYSCIYNDKAVCFIQTEHEKLE